MRMQKEITRRLFEKWMNEYTEELKQARLDFTKRYEKEVNKKRGGREELVELILALPCLGIRFLQVP